MLDPTTFWGRRPVSAVDQSQFFHGRSFKRFFCNPWSGSSLFLPISMYIPVCSRIVVSCRGVTFHREPSGQQKCWSILSALLAFMALVDLVLRQL
jgi:hypothetical protein